jgi:hypothetical protein
MAIPAIEKGAPQGDKLEGDLGGDSGLLKGILQWRRARINTKGIFDMGGGMTIQFKLTGTIYRWWIA